MTANLIINLNYETGAAAGKLAYYASIMLDVSSCLLCPKLCWCNWHKPNVHAVSSYRWYYEKTDDIITITGGHIYPIRKLMGIATVLSV